MEKKNLPEQNTKWRGRRRRPLQAGVKAREESRVVKGPMTTVIVSAICRYNIALISSISRFFFMSHGYV